MWETTAETSPMSKLLLLRFHLTSKGETLTALLLCNAQASVAWQMDCPLLKQTL